MVTSLEQNTLIFLLKKNREAFALQKLLTFFSTKNIGVFEILNFWNFNETLTNDVVSFEQPDPNLYTHMHFIITIDKKV